MKKGILFFVGFIIIIMIVLYGLQNKLYTLEDGTSAIITIKEEKEINLNQFISEYKEEKYEKIELIDSTKLKGYELLEEKEGINSFALRKNIKEIVYNVYKTNKPSDTSINELGFYLTGSVPIEVKYTETSIWGKILEQILPLLFLVLLLLFVFKILMPKGGGFPFGAQAGKLRTKADVKTSFKDVAGMEEAKDEVNEIVDYLKNPSKYQKVGARIPRGVLLYGPPGSGKTLLARAIAGEADVPFYSASGSEFMEMLVGMGAAKVRELFKKAQMSAPAIIFIDEIDTIGKKRGAGYTGGHQEQEQTLNQILTEMDGFQKETKVIVIAATNRPEILDPALLRPGRFDRKVLVGNPTIEERIEILKIHCEDKKLDESVDLETLAKRTSGFVGADLANICNEAALKTARENRKTLTMEDFEYSLEKVVMGPEKKIKTIKEKERKTIAYHELGHAVTAYYLEHSYPVEKISIVKRGMALGITWMSTEEDRYLQTKLEFLDELVTLLGGRASEEVFFGNGEITTGASNDLMKATKIITDMLLKYGMDNDLGTILYYNQENSEWQPYKPYSENTAELIDNKIKKYIGEAYERAKKIIGDNKKTIDILAEVLFEKEFLTKEEFESIMKDPKTAKIISEKAREIKEKALKKEKEDKETKDKQNKQEELEKEEKEDKENKNNKKKNK